VHDGISEEHPEAEWVLTAFEASLLADPPAAVDPCGENGVPGIDPVTAGAVFVFADLVPAGRLLTSRAGGLIRGHE
jgi:hypothetical protein